MKCRRVKRLLSDYIDDELSPSLRAEVESHLASCPDCSGERVRLARLVKETNELGGGMSPWDLWPGVQRRLQIAALKPNWRLVFGQFARRPLIAAPAIGTLVAILGIALSALLGGGAPPKMHANKKLYVEYMRAYSQYRGQQPLADADALIAAADLTGGEIQGESQE